MPAWNWLTVAFVALVALIQPAAAGTVHPDCAGNATCEMSRRDADFVGEFAVGLACYHGPSATLAVIAKPCQAYAADGTYIEWTQDVGWTYNQGDGTYYWGAHKSPGTALSGWQIVAGTPYRWIKSATLPVVTDPGFVLLGEATVLGTAVTQAVELVPRRFQPRDPLTTVPLGITRHLGSCPTAGRWPLWVADGLTSGIVSFATACNLLPEWWGATGDGVTLDGKALWGLVSGLNAALPDTLPLTVTFGPGRTYVITGHDSDTGNNRREGLQKITKSDVEIVAYNAELKVPADYAYINTTGQVPPAPNLQEAAGLRFDGWRCSLRGGKFNGNLAARTVNGVGGTDGAEIGLRLGPEAADFRMQDVTFREWGTDNMYITVGLEGMIVRSSVFDKPRRNNVTVVLSDPDSRGVPEKPIIFDSNELRNAGQYPLDVQRRPGAGFHIEGIGVTNDATRVSVHLINNIFVNNRNVNVTMQSPGYRHVLKGNLFKGVFPPAVTGGDGDPVYTGGIYLGPADKGGHVIIGNIFESGGFTVSNDAPNVEPIPPDERVIISNNVFKGTTAPVAMFPIAGQPTYVWPSGWAFTNNTVVNMDRHTETGFKNNENYSTHLFGGNVYKNPTEFMQDVHVPANSSVTMDLTPHLGGTATYMVIVKGNNGSGTYDAVGMYLLTWFQNTFEGGWDFFPTYPPNTAFEAVVTGGATAGTGHTHAVTFPHQMGACGRKVTRVNAVITYDNEACSTPSQFGLIAYQLGRGDFGR